MLYTHSCAVSYSRITVHFVLLFHSYYNHGEGGYFEMKTASYIFMQQKYSNLSVLVFEIVEVG